jgi:hypothetical protein
MCPLAPDPPCKQIVAVGGGGGGVGAGLSSPSHLLAPISSFHPQPTLQALAHKAGGRWCISTGWHPVVPLLLHHIPPAPLPHCAPYHCYHCSTHNPPHGQWLMGLGQVVWCPLFLSTLLSLIDTLVSCLDGEGVVVGHGPSHVGFCLES